VDKSRLLGFDSELPAFARKIAHRENYRWYCTGDMGTYFPSLMRNLKHSEEISRPRLPATENKGFIGGHHGNVGWFGPLNAFYLALSLV